MSSPSSPGSVELDSMFNARRRMLASIGETSSTRPQSHSTDTICVQREDRSNSILSIESSIVISGELGILYRVFETFNSNIIASQESNRSHSNKTSFSATFEADEPVDDDDDIHRGSPPIVSSVRELSLSSQSSSPPQASTSPLARWKKLSSIGRSHTVSSARSDNYAPKLELQGYGSIQLPDMSIIEILEILSDTDLELLDISSSYDGDKTLHQTFIFSKSRLAPQPLPQQHFARSSSMTMATL